ncbi:acyl-CoA carboxylase subunit epsilon [Actinophytocola sp.]|uniref:acyl-CoA carboxylase subunit epsilon n=1 Tax=Actinophytocola sp. TaxID=1872138 RepID=UPI002ED4924E
MSERPHLRIVKGNPSDEELAALVAVVSAVDASASDSASEESARNSAWSDRRGLVREPLPHGPGAWRASGFPR